MTGSEPVARDKLIQYLMSEYRQTPEDAEKLILKHKAIFSDGLKKQSFTYYVGDLIADEEGLMGKVEVEHGHASYNNVDFDHLQGQLVHLRELIGKALNLANEIDQELGKR
jgi:hypothetical protein